MVIYIGSDHRGFKLKVVIKSYLKDSGYEVSDLSEIYSEGDDYPDHAKEVASRVRLNANSVGVLLCGSGAGVDIVANKFPGIRSVLGVTPDQVAASKQDDNTNILCIAADYVDEKTAKQMVAAWMQTPFSGQERHVRRIRKIDEIESEIAKAE